MKAWKDVTIPEMKHFIALLLQMGICNLPSIDHYWSRDVLYRTDLWKHVMSRNRFQLILRFLHFNDNAFPSTKRLAKISPLEFFLIT